MIDVEVARTFLAIIETGTFKLAAEKVFVTQSTVSARVKTLEDQLGQAVFDRGRNGARLTPAGRQFERFARAIVRAWEQGRQQAGLPAEFEERLIVGGQHNLWNRFLPTWLKAMADALPDVAFSAVTGTTLSLSRRLSEGSLDIAVLHQPRFRIDIEIEPLMEDELILVTTDPDGRYRDRYVFMDWGEAFGAFHAQYQPDVSDARLSSSIGFFGARFLIAVDGAGYMPRRLVSPHLDAGFLYEVPDQPRFNYPVFVAYQADTPSRVYTPALRLLRKTAAITGEDALPSPFWQAAARGE